MLPPLCCDLHLFGDLADRLLDWLFWRPIQETQIDGHDLIRRVLIEGHGRGAVRPHCAASRSPQ